MNPYERSTKWLSDGTPIKLNENEMLILNCIKINPWCCTRTIAKSIKKTIAYVVVYLSRMFPKGLLRRKKAVIKNHKAFVYHIGYNAKGII